ncbi:MAG TPA: hypothetical protein HPQ03_08310 [Deltaproteobacteria bacterium]|nr:hypothetical protein [Deltaproteobacteria bacterium]
MGIKAVIHERRRRRRFSVRESAIAVIQSTPTILLGQIKDISMDGLSFIYMHRDKQPDESTTLDIFLPDDKLHIKGLAFRTVSDSIVLNDNPYSTVIMNRRSIQFKKLTDQLKSELEYVIQILTRADLETGCPIYNIKNLARMSV